MVLEMDSVSKRFGRSRALEGATLAVGAGEVVGLAGPNGAGKTTAMHLLLGVLEADAGSLRVLGEDPLLRRRLGEIGWMPELPRFPPGWRVGRTIRFQAATFPRWDSGLADGLGRRLALDPRARVEALSRGQVARLALLLALGHRPRLLLLDDPTLGLDPAGRRLLLGELLGAAAESGCGILLATHLLREVEPALDRLVILHRGRVVLDRPVGELRRTWRRLHLPPGAPPPPVSIGPLTAGGECFATRWDESEWRPWAAAVPGAEAAPLDLEDVLIAQTGGAL